MKQLLHLLAFGLLVPSTALAQVNAEVVAQCRDARDFYGCVRAFTLQYGVPMTLPLLTA